MDKNLEDKKPQIVRYYMSSIIAGKKHHYIAVYDKKLNILLKPQDFIFNKDELKRWI